MSAMRAREDPASEQGVPTEDAAALQERLIRAWPAGGAHATVRHVETHISHVLLVGRYAYKIKKPVNFGFLDFSTLEKRRLCCEEELRLNRRLAPEIYRAVIPVTGTPDAPVLGGDRGNSRPFEYAVKMRRFAQSALLDRLLARKALGAGVIDALADRVAVFHAQAPKCAKASDFGSPEVVWSAVSANFRQLRKCLSESGACASLDRLEQWSTERHARLSATFTARRADMVRECHGDLHLGNIVLIKGQPVIFDCIEFSPGLRWIDVISEIAFMVMDLEERGRRDYGHRFLNRYLEQTGDYAALPLLPYYQVYRALVRAKVAALRAGQEAEKNAKHELAMCNKYLAYAERIIQPVPCSLTLFHGLSGSGKSWAAQILLEATGAIRLRSDVERKRLAGFRIDGKTRSEIHGGIYTREATAATYARLAELARETLGAGYPVLIDAACLEAWQREMFRALAEESGVPFAIVHCRAPEDVLRRRLMARELSGNDASEADASVLEAQIASQEPLTREELACCRSVDTDGCAPSRLLEQLAPEAYGDVSGECAGG